MNGTGIVYATWTIPTYDPNNIPIVSYDKPSNSNKDDTGIVYATQTIPTYDPNNIPIVSYDKPSNTNDILQNTCNISYTSYSSCEVPNYKPEVKRGVPLSQFESHRDPKDWYKLYRLPNCIDFVYIGYKHNPALAVPTNLHTKYPIMVRYAGQIKSTMTRTEFATVMSQMFREFEVIWTDFKVCPHGDSIKQARYDQTEHDLLHKQDFPDNCRVTWFSRLNEVEYQFGKNFSILNIAIANRCSKFVLENSYEGRVYCGIATKYFSTFKHPMVPTVYNVGAYKPIYEIMDLLAGFYELSVSNIVY